MTEEKESGSVSSVGPADVLLRVTSCGGVWLYLSRLCLRAMAKDPLADAGLHFDELNKLRVLDPDVSQKTNELKEECKDFVDSTFI